jgi:hypothetical protein
MPPGNAVGHHPRGAECEFYQQIGNGFGILKELLLFVCRNVSA